MNGVNIPWWFHRRLRRGNIITRAKGCTRSETSYVGIGRLVDCCPECSTFSEEGRSRKIIALGHRFKFVAQAGEFFLVWKNGCRLHLTHGKCSHIVRSIFVVPESLSCDWITYNNQCHIFDPCIQGYGETKFVKLRVAVNRFDITTCHLPGIKGETNSNAFGKGNVSDADSTPSGASVRDKLWSASSELELIMQSCMLYFSENSSNRPPTNMDMGKSLPVPLVLLDSEGLPSREMARGFWSATNNFTYSSWESKCTSFCDKSTARPCWTEERWLPRGYF